MSILKILFPDCYSCKACGVEIIKGTEFCDKCKKEIRLIDGKTCKCCGTEIKRGGDVCLSCRHRAYYFDKNYAVFPYTEAVKKLIVKYKTKHALYLTDFLVDGLYNKFVKENIDVDVISYVPCTKRSEKLKGFSHARELATKLAKKVGLPLFDDVAKIKETAPQKELPLKERVQNVVGAFKVNQRLDGKRVLIVDDKFTTGATMSEMAKEFRKAGASVVLGLTLSVNDEYAPSTAKTIENIE